MIRLIHGARTDIGVTRSTNEDSLASEVSADRGLFVVADGVGGLDAGEVASTMAAQAIAEEVGDVGALEAFDLVYRARRAADAANRVVHERARSATESRRMGTTMSALLIAGDRYVVAQVGDSRVYLLRDSSLGQITKDHTLVQEQVDAGVLSLTQARDHPYSHVITRCLGTSWDVDADIYEGEVRLGDRFLLATDGLTGVLDDDRLREVLLTRASPDEKTRALISEANERGGPDNITAIVVEVMSSDDDKAVP